MLQYQSNYWIQTGYQEIDLITNIENDSLSLFSFTNEICKVNSTYSITDSMALQCGTQSPRSPPRGQQVSHQNTGISGPTKRTGVLKIFFYKFHFSFQIKTYFLKSVAVSVNLSVN